MGSRSESLSYAHRRRVSSAGPPMTVAPWTLGEPAEGKPPMGTLTRPAVTGPTQSADAMSTPEDAWRTAFSEVHPPSRPGFEQPRRRDKS